jgi:hypothetical protein
VEHAREAARQAGVECAVDLHPSTVRVRFESKKRRS